jgi:hypothetical protein
MVNLHTWYVYTRQLGTESSYQKYFSYLERKVTGTLSIHDTLNSAVKTLYSQ